MKTVFKETIFKLTSLVLIVFSLSSCSVGSLNRTQGGALGGALSGAGLGAIIGSQTGDAGAGVAIGSAAGALSGALLGNQLERVDRQNKENLETIKRQEDILAENRRIIQELKGNGADVTETSRGVVVNIPDVLFNFDSSRLNGEARSRIDDIADILTRYSSRRASVEGHTDSIGSVTYNKNLSLKRADTVSQSLIRRGVSASRVSSRGFGEGGPVATNNTDEGRARNRRVEIIIENSR